MMMFTVIFFHLGFLNMDEFRRSVISMDTKVIMKKLRSFAVVVTRRPGLFVPSSVSEMDIYFSMAGHCV